jgi:hypothetical protein
MARYRKKPVEIEAERVPVYEEWESTTAYLDRCLELADWCGGVSHMMINEEDGHGIPNHIAIETLEGTMQARPGDFIIKGVSDEFYPCKPHIFEATYERVEEREAV